MLEMKSFFIYYLEVIIFLSTGSALWSFYFHKTKKKQSLAKDKLKNSIERKMNEPLTLHPEINSDLCGGCGGCTKACPEGDILQLINNKAVLVSPTKCVGHGECEKSCPFGAINLVFGTKTRGMKIPQINGNFESNIPGLYIAGELGGMGLIRNAIKQGALAAEDAISKIQQDIADQASFEAEYDLLIVGGGPAGLAAGLVAIKENMSYIILEQNSFGGTVFNYPRQKIVMSHPAELPITGIMKFPKNTASKEMLLDYWYKIRDRTGLKVTEKCRFEGLKKLQNGNFEVKSAKGVINSKKVVLAMGVRGSPRKLGLANEDLSKVMYNLMDPQEYFEKCIMIVGGGNAAVEAAQSLAMSSLNNTVHLLVREDSLDRCNEENQRKILEMKALGLLKIWYKSTIHEISRASVLVKNDYINQNKIVKLPNDYLFIFAGAEVPFEFLQNLGIKIDKKFGEPFKVNITVP
jgi:thioredoxin reductase/NAD-dependent dihydropyrimidine dehydrogenase PreA subunit